MAIRLFELREGKISLARAEIGMYKEFSAILRRDRGGKNDADGRKKYKAMQEFFYIFLIADYESPLVNKGYSGKDLKIKANSEAQLPMTWRHDDVIQKAIDKYKELNFDVKGELLTELLLLFRGNYKRVTNLREHIDTLLERPELSRTEIDHIAQLSQRIFEIAAETPTKIKLLQRAVKDAEALDSIEEKELRGGGRVPESADVNRAKS